MHRWLAGSMVVLGVTGAGGLAVAPAQADEAPYHVLSAQDLCNLIWPSSQLMPDPEKFGAVCVRQGGLLSRLSRALPGTISNTLELKPGVAPELPVGSARVDSNDALSSWVIPDCDIPNRIDCA